MASYAKNSVAEYHQFNSRFPNNQTEAGLPAATSIVGINVSSIAVGTSGVITINFGGDSNLVGKTVLLSPSSTSDKAGSILWICSSTTLDSRFLPSNCR
ncbi:MAG: pilin [Magnetococcus sp. DMHC-6]